MRGEVFLDNENVTQKSGAVVPVKHPWLVMAGMLIGAFVGMLSETSLNIALPALGQAFGVGNGVLQWLVTGYMLVIGIVLPFSSLITRWFTTRQVILFALFAFFVGAIISATAGSFSLLLIGRLIQGIGTGLILPLLFTVAMLIFPPNKLGAAMGINGLVIMFAPAVGPTLTGILIGALSWRAVFYVFAAIILIGFIIAAFFLENISKITKPKVDVLSVITSIIGFASLVAGVGIAGENSWASLEVWALLVIAVIALFFYSRRQLQLEEPVLNLAVLAKPQFLQGTTMVMLDFGLILATMYIMPQFIQKSMLLPVSLTGIIMLPGGVVNAVVSAFAGRMYDRIGVKLPTRLGFFLAIIGLIMFVMAKPSSSVAYMIAAHIILMIGAPLAMSPAQTSALNALKGHESADGSTIMNTFQQIVGALATALTAGFIAMGTQAMPTAAKAAQFANGAHYAFIFALVVAIVALVVSVVPAKNEKNN